ncbi:hypothetical protein QL285_050134 [Trifolium repens]|nr:hypothetical protein QL285_050134 [Trifolium repens]
MMVNNCNSLEEIITGSEGVNIALTSLEILMLGCLPKLNKFCSSKCLLRLPLLDEVVVRECPRMKIFSDGEVSTPILQKVKTAQDVGKWNLKRNLNDIIKNMFEDKVAFCESEQLNLSEYPEMKDVWYGQIHPNVFCNLKSLVVQLCDFLPNVLFPSNILQVLHGLEELEVRDCDSLETVFDVKGFQQPNQVDEIHDMPFQIALFSIEKVSPDLKELSLYAKDALKILNGCCQENLFQKVEVLRLQCFEETPITFLNGFHAMFPNVVKLQVGDSSFETLFRTTGIDHLNSRSPKQIRDLELFELEQLRCIWQEDFPLEHLVVHNLEGLSIRNCPNLISFVPSSVSLKNLTNLEVDSCKGLIYLITTETAKSLVQLTRLVIKNCEMMLDVVEIDQEKAEEDIIFENLEILEFSSLLSLRSFCYGNGKQTFIFPSLLYLNVQGCPQMEIFSSGVTIAPFLTEVEVENEKKRWKVDLNTTIKQLFVEQEVSSSTEK